MQLVRISTILFVLCISVLSTMLGMDWILDGYGLHPAVAFPLAILSMAYFLHLFIKAHNLYNN